MPAVGTDSDMAKSPSSQPSLLKGLGRLPANTHECDKAMLALLGPEAPYWVRQYGRWAERESSNHQATGYIPSNRMRAKDYIEMLKNGFAQANGLYLAMHTGNEEDKEEKARFQTMLSQMCHMEAAVELAGMRSWLSGSSDLALWFGPPGHCEHLHMDAYSNIHFQLCGVKTWYLFPPHCDLSPVPLLSSVTSPGGAQINFSTLSLTEATKIAPLTVIVVHPGEAIYVPAGWWHQVVSSSDGECSEVPYVVSVNCFEPDSVVPWSRSVDWHFARLRVGDWLSSCNDYVRYSLLGHSPPTVEMPPGVL